MIFDRLGGVRTATALACLFWTSVPAYCQTRPVPQPQQIWGAVNVTVYRNSPKYFSASGNHYLAYQPDGNLVVSTKSGQFVWGLNTVTRQSGSTQRITFANGNIMAYDASGKVVWQAITPPNPVDRNARPYLTDNGILQMFYCRMNAGGSDGGIFWASDNKTRKGCGQETPTGSAPVTSTSTGTPTPKPTPAPPATAQQPNAKFAASLPVPAGMALERGKKYTSASKLHSLTFAKDGNLVVAGGQHGRFVWGVHELAKNFQKSDRVELRPDGSFVMLDANGGTVWAAPQKRKDPRATLTLSSSGALQVVVPGGEILWSSDGILTPAINVVSKKASTTACVPKTEGAPEWDKCIQMAEPKMIIFGSKLATMKAMNAVANVYTEMTSRFAPAYPKNKLDGFRVYLTNGESASALQGLPPAGTMWKDPTGPKSAAVLRGGASQDFLWISEQMICKEGIKTHNVNPQALGLKEPDYAIRTYDQVIHELGHSLHWRYGIADTSEQWPQAIQSWFGAPASKPDPAKDPLVKRLFTSRATFSCDSM